MFARLLVAYDGSDNSRRALEVAADLAVRCGARLQVAKVVDLASLMGLELEGQVIDELRSKAEREVHDAVEFARSKGADADGSVLVGDPVESIVELAQGMGVDLIVTGSRGLSRLKRILLGSVSTGILTEAKCSVLVVK
ncbi:universal stress protein [Conexivisphaera calida]|uniref:universal stress protein n=1 Tax=Conexivisphaera calida TaxID=1874277 RepID=UPI00157AAC6D|nr:universal stress protein [Conexivisphaera calida]